MFEEIAAHYLVDKAQAAHLGGLLGVINNYEFSAYCFGSERSAYLIVEGADSERIRGINGIVKQELGYEVTGWYVLREQARDTHRHPVVLSRSGIDYEDLPLVTYYRNDTPIWLLRVRRVDDAGPESQRRSYAGPELLS